MHQIYPNGNGTSSGDNGLIGILQRFIAAKVNYHLFTNNVTITENTTLAGLTEAVASGYAAVTVVPASFTLVGLAANNGSVMAAPIQQRDECFRVNCQRVRVLRHRSRQHGPTCGRKFRFSTDRGHKRQSIPARRARVWEFFAVSELVRRQGLCASSPVPKKRKPGSSIVGAPRLPFLLPPRRRRRRAGRVGAVKTNGSRTQHP